MYRLVIVDVTHSLFCSGILFKFARGMCFYFLLSLPQLISKPTTDSRHIYGSDENAMKAAAHEFKGLMRYINNMEGLCVPLMQLIDYRCVVCVVYLSFLTSLKPK